MPLPPPEAAGEPVAHGVQVGTTADGRLTLVDPTLSAGARDDAIGRELHGEVIGQAVKWRTLLLLVRHLELLPKLGWIPAFAAQIQRLLTGIAG